jgi:hypothetical protein
MDDIEDMLFGTDASHDYFQDASEDSDDDMLDDGDDDELNLWDVEDSPLLTPATIDNEVEEQIDVLETATQRKDNPTRPTHDR